MTQVLTELVIAELELAARHKVRMRAKWVALLIGVADQEVESVLWELHAQGAARQVGQRWELI